ncbi:MAG: holo-ACP synthase [Vampirovibrionales bacterium]|nr:holo-ACP synthase [Vampirovibrionales bacterium]
MSSQIACDLVWIPRVQRALDRYGHRWVQRLLSCEEYAYCCAENVPKRRQIERIAARLAVKEAIAKVLGVGVCGLGYQDGIRWQDVSFNHQREITLLAKARAFADRKGFSRWQASVAHDGDYAMATVLAERDHQAAL